MKIDLNKVLDEPFRWEETETVAAATLDCPEILEIGPVRWRGSVEATPSGFVLRARLDYEQTLTCSRCMEPTGEPVSGEIALIVKIDRSKPAAGEYELREDDLDILVLRDEILDTDPILLEQLQLNVPMRILCREGCRGLCPVCGKNRNDEGCDCSERMVDPRWEALAALRNDARTDD